MTCRSEVLDAFDGLGRTTGRSDFAVAEVIGQMRAAGSSYKDSTIRTHVSAHMVADGSLLRVAVGQYRLARHRGRPVEPVPQPAEIGERRTSEDDVKAAVAGWLIEAGWEVTVAWGRQRGIDIDARRGAERLVIEAKGQAAAGPQQVNYFLGALGELVQRMDDPTARYGLALPEHRQYLGLVERLPAFGRECLGLEVFFVDGEGSVRRG